MKRSPIVLLGTVAGVAGVLMLNPNGETLGITASADSSGSTADTSTTTSSTKTTTNAVTAAPASTGVSGTATGDAVYVRWGYVQLEVTVDNGVITEIKELQMPDQDGKSLMISQMAGPRLTSQVLEAQSADINGISGATYTTTGYKQSVQSALDQLGF